MDMRELNKAYKHLLEFKRAMTKDMDEEEKEYITLMLKSMKVLSDNIMDYVKDKVMLSDYGK